MAHYQSLPVFKEAYDLLLSIFTAARTFQRDFRYTIGEDLKRVMLRLLVTLFRANRTREKAPEVFACRELIEQVKIYLRILHDLKQISMRQYVLLAERAETVSKQLAAWDKYIAKHPPGPAAPASGFSGSAAPAPGSPGPAAPASGSSGPAAPASGSPGPASGSSGPVGPPRGPGGADV